MGTLTSTLSQAGLGTALKVGAGLAGNQISRKQSQRRREQSLQQLQAQQRLQQQQLAQDAALQRQQISTNAAQDEEERRAALRRAVARQRANFGSQGVGSASGSSQAVLLGLFDESDDEARRREALDNLRLTGIEQGVDQRASLNVLQRTQLAQRNDLARSADRQDFGFDVLKAGVSIYNEGDKKNGANTLF